MLAATLGASVETSVAVGYPVSQRQGWHWGIGRRASNARRFYLLVVGTLGAATVIMLAGVDPIQITDFTLVISAVALPLTYLPSWLAARQRRTMGSHANRRLTDWVAGAPFAGICVVAVAAVPLWILAHTGA